MLKFYVPDYGSPRASSRLRASIPAKEYGSVIKNISDVSLDDVVVFSKKSSIYEIKYVIDRGIKFIFDICDDQFQDPVYEKLFSYACSNCNLITVPSEKMREVVEKNSYKNTFITLDPYERVRRNPSFSPSDKIKILFFGCVDNFSTIPWGELVSSLSQRNINFKIDAIINYQHQYNICNDFFQTHEWSFDMHTELMNQCDLVLLPFKDNIKNISTKSPNRVVESINAGKFVITNRGVDSYNIFKDYIFLEDYESIVDGIIWSINNPSLVMEKIVKGQEFVEKNYSAKSVSETWRKAYDLVKNKI